MSKWSYLSPLLSLSFQLLRNDDVREKLLRRVGRPVGRGFNGASDRLGDAIDVTVERLLDAANLQRRPTTLDQLRSHLGWAGAGAAVATGALLASRLDGEQLDEWVDETRSRLGGAASRSARRFQRAAVDEGLELLGRVGLQPRPSPTTRALRAAGWIGAGTLAGASAVALAWALSRRRYETAPAAEEQTDETAGARPDEASAAPAEGDPAPPQWPPRPGPAMDSN